MKTHRSLTLALALAVLVTASARAEDAAPAQDVARAEAYASSAYDAYARADYAAAVSLYRQALSAAHSANTIYNLARIYDVKLHDRGQAIEFYQQYTQDTGADPDLLQTAEERLARLRELEKVATQPAPVAPSTATPSASVQPQRRAARAKEPARDHDGGLGGWQVAGLVVGPVGLVGLGLGVGFGLSAKSDNDVAKNECEGNLCRSQQGVDAAHDAGRKADISTVAFIAGGALTAIGATLLLLGGGDDSPREEPRAALAALYVGPDAIATSIAGRW